MSKIKKPEEFVEDEGRLRRIEAVSIFPDTKTIFMPRDVEILSSTLIDNIPTIWFLNEFGTDTLVYQVYQLQTRDILPPDIYKHLGTFIKADKLTTHVFIGAYHDPRKSNL